MFGSVNYYPKKRIDMNKTLIISALTVLSCNSHALTPVTDHDLSKMTGQAGISIELETKVNIAEFRWTDTDQGGSLSVNGITFGGANKDTFFGRRIGSINPTDKLDDMRIDIDVNSQGTLLVNLGATSTCIGCIGTSPVDFGLSFDSISLGSADGVSNSTIVSDFSMTGYFTAAFFGITERNGSSQVFGKVSAAVDDLDVKFDVIGVEIEDMFIASGGFLEDQRLGAFDIANSGVVTRFEMQTVDVPGVDDALNIKLYGNAGPGDPIVADMGIGALKVGGASIGSIEIDNLKLYDTSLTIYGH